MIVSDHEQEFVEACGLYFESAGLTRIAGKVIEWLLICDPPHRLQSDLVAALQASKSASAPATLANNCAGRMASPAR
jgi:DNA-binding transcriptional regulator GbsR (MarR family)